MAGERVLVIDDSPTILKVVQLVLSKGGYLVRTAPDGEAGLRLAEEERPDLILLDFVMPKLNGYQVCQALSSSSDLRKVPVVLMSAKGDQVGERFVKMLGIVDYITKPFSPEAILAVVDHTLSRYGVEGSPSPEEESARNREAAPISNTTQPRSLEEERRRKQLFARLREAVQVALDEPALSEEIHRQLSDERLETIVRDLGLLPDSAVVLEGHLLAVPAADVLALLQQQRQTGILAVAREPARVDVHFRRGRVDFVAGTGMGEEFLLGRFLVAEAVMSRNDLDRFFDSRQGSQRPMGEELIRANLVTESDLRKALSRQSSERLFEVLRWAGGHFSFRSTQQLGALADGAALQLSVDGLLMEGVRRVDEWHLIEREIDDFDSVFLRNDEGRTTDHTQLTRDELAVLELVNGKHTVREIIRQSRLGSFEVAKMLFRLRSIRLIRRRVSAIAV